jgi:hypothetical protein
MTDPRLDRLLDGVESAPNRFERLFDNLVEELPSGDFIAAYDLADLMLNNKEAILWALVTKH